MTSADVYKAGTLAARLFTDGADTRFEYLPSYAGPPVAHTLPRGRGVIRPGRTLPPFFTNLLPEGRRLSALVRAVKTSADDELTLLLATGADTVGDVQVVPSGEPPAQPPPLVSGDSPPDFGALMADYGVDRVGIPGAQDKLSAGMITLPGSARDGAPAFVKLTPPDYPFAVENEAYFMSLARRLRLPVADAELVTDSAGVTGLFVRRFDRTPARLAVEDACQIMGRYPADKYLISAEDVAMALAAACAARPVALRNIFLQFAFAWLMGNGDLHAKNLSVLQEPGGEWRIAPLYDVLSTLPYRDHSLALRIGGRTEGLIRRHLVAFGQELGLPVGVIERALDTALRATAGLDEDLAGGALPFNAATTQALRRQLSRRRKDALP
ncbi:type II toxin-antitoxin system HipA family toxin [Tessaracoccus sp. G1721]